MKIKCICEACDKEFERERCYVERSIRNGHRITCKRGCINRIEKKLATGDSNPAWKGGATRYELTCPVCKCGFRARKTRTYCSRKCYADSQSFSQNKHDHNIRRHYEYSKIAKSILGRPLKSNEVVHHKDGDYTNNHPSNLQIMTRKDHTSLHAKLRHQMRRKAL